MTARTSRRRLSLTGELTILTAAAQHQKLCASLAASANLDVNLSGVTELDTAGLQLLLAAKREATRLGGRLAYRQPSQAVRDVLAVAQLTPDLEA